jgi:hypothetical protein
MIQRLYYIYYAITTQCEQRNSSGNNEVNKSKKSKVQKAKVMRATFYVKNLALLF